MTTITASIIAGLVLLSIGLSVKIAQLLHSLKLSNRENENIRKEISESNKRQIQEASNKDKKHSETEANLKKEILSLEKENTELKNLNGEGPIQSTLGYDPDI